jgi:hypothetical protein
MIFRLHQMYSMLNKVNIVVLVFLSSVFSFSVQADYKGEIIESCEAYQAGTNKEHVNACKLYIDGFIDAALVTEDALIMSVNQNNGGHAEQSAFVQRAYQTRLPRRLSSKIDNVDYQFCLESDPDRVAIASNIAKELNISELESKPLKKILFETLVRIFPCDL